MKYLVVFRPQSAAQPSDDALARNKAAMAYIADLQEKGILEAGYAFVTGGGIGILEVPSHEQLWQLLFAYPLYSSHQWQVEPLADLGQGFDKGIAMLEKVAEN